MNQRFAVFKISDELHITAKDLQVPIDLVRYVHQLARLPVVNFAAGGVATPADAADAVGC